MDYILILYMIGAALTGAGTLFGFNKLSEMAAKRWFAKQDKREIAFEAIETKLIDADQLALKILHDDFITLKDEVKALRKQLEEVKDERASLKAENTILRNNEQYLEGRISRQSERITKLESDLSLTNALLSEAKAAIGKRDNEVEILRGELNLAVQAMNDFKRGTEQL